MNNEPVAWFYPNGSPDQCTTNKEYAEMYPPWTPLYTHPVKKLTDEEILEIAGEKPSEYGNQLIEFARAILRKAQEK